jgi:ankyrin repeat protein
LTAAGADINKTNKQGETPLLAAIQRYETGYAQRLVDAGADVNATTVRGVTPLLEAIHRNSRVLVGKLLAKGANVNVTEPYYNQTPLMLMANQGMVDEMKIAIEKGAGVNVQDKHGRTTLHLVVHAQRNGEAAAKLLLSKGGNPLIKDAQQYTAYDYAATTNARGIVALYDEHLRKTGQPKYTPRRVPNPYWRWGGPVI